MAVHQGAIGTFEKMVTVRGDFVISPNVPTFAAPGDTFDVTVSVANNVVGSGKDAKVALALATSSHVESIGPARVELPISELREGHGAFRLRATQRLGSASLTFTASLGGKSAKLVTDLSVRPQAPYQVTFAAGHLDPGGSTDGRVARALHPEFQTLRAGISHVPLGLAHGLVGYLEKFPHGCTEQLVSQGIPAVALASHPEFGFDRATADRSVQKVIEMLAARQNSDGAFGLWAAGPHVGPMPSAWGVHFLLEAKERGHDVPPALLKNALGWLKSIASSPGESMLDERLRAYATYLLTRGGMVTSAFAAGIKKRLEAEHAKEWNEDDAAVWLAATYGLLHEDRLARNLLDDVHFAARVEADWENYHDGLIRDSVLLYVLARHFPERARRLGASEINAVAQPIFNGTYNTLSSATAILALAAYAETATGDSTGGFTVAEVGASGARKVLPLPANLLPWTEFSAGARAIHFETSGPFPAYWLVSQAGFDTTLPTKPVAQRLEVFREYTGEDGKTPIARVQLGDEIQVHVRVRGLGAALPNIAIVDLLPGGFEVVVKRAEGGESDEPAPRVRHHAPEGDEGEGEGEEHEGGDGAEESGDAEPPAPFALPIALGGSSFALDYGDVREDRVVLYGSAGDKATEFIYAIKAVSAGTFAIAPVFAESLYDRGASARGVGGSIVVVAR